MNEIVNDTKEFNYFTFKNCNLDNFAKLSFLN